MHKERERERERERDYSKGRVGGKKESKNEGGVGGYNTNSVEHTDLQRR